VARAAVGAQVVKALHLFAGASWPYVGPQAAAPVVAICGDEPGALDRAAALIGDLGGQTAVVGGLGSSRQLEEAAGFVMRIVAAGHNPRPSTGEGRDVAVAALSFIPQDPQVRQLAQLRHADRTGDEHAEELCLVDGRSSYELI
jgi:hypothetical protein